MPDRLDPISDYVLALVAHRLTSPPSSQTTNVTPALTSA